MFSKYILKLLKEKPYLVIEIRDFLNYGIEIFLKDIKDPKYFIRRYIYYDDIAQDCDEDELFELVINEMIKEIEKEHNNLRSRGIIL